MPMYLKRETIRFLESSVEAICLSITSLGLPKRFEFRVESAENAITIGLAGIAIELAMSAIIVQADNEKALRLPSGFYKTGSMIIEDFKNLVSARLPKMVFLTQGVDRKSEHIDEIIKSIAKCKLLTSLRAAGIHAGRGPSRDVCIACVNDVINFIELLGKSIRIKPYTSTLPKPIKIQKSYDLIIDDLLRKMKDAPSTKEKASALSSIYLVLPELPDNQPEWIKVFENQVVSPKDNDISFLLDILENSKYASLIKVSKSEIGIPVVIKTGEEGAIPIEPQFLKKSFTSIRDRWAADRGTANGRLDEGQYDPPPIESVYELFAFGFERLQITKNEDDMLNATDTWSLICSSLSYSGTQGPIWYFVRRTKDLGQLDAYLSKAKKIGDARLNNRLSEFKIGLESIKKDKPLASENKVVNIFIEESEISSYKKEQLIQLVIKYIGKEKELPQNAVTDIELVVDESMPLGEVLVQLIEGKYQINASVKSFWVRSLCEAAIEREDAEGLLAVLKSQDMEVAHTAARKALQIIDFLNYGPQIE